MGTTIKRWKAQGKIIVLLALVASTGCTAEGEPLWDTESELDASTPAVEGVAVTRSPPSRIVNPQLKTSGTTASIGGAVRAPASSGSNPARRTAYLATPGFGGKARDLPATGAIGTATESTTDNGTRRGEETPNSPDIIPESIAGHATDKIDLLVNLDSNTAISLNDSVAPPEVLPFDPQSPGVSSDFSTDVTVYDTAFQPHNVAVYFDKIINNGWEWHALVNGGELSGGTAGVYEEVSRGRLVFTSDGWLEEDVQDMLEPFAFAGAPAPQTIEFDFGPTAPAWAPSFFYPSSTAQYASGSTIWNSDQNGYPPGSLVWYTRLNDGRFLAVYDSAQILLFGYPERENATPDRHLVLWPEATRSVVFTCIFDRNAEISAPHPSGWVPPVSSGVENSFVVLDSEGRYHELRVSFSKVGEHLWEYRVIDDNPVSEIGETLPPIVLAIGRIELEEEGRLVRHLRGLVGSDPSTGVGFQPSFDIKIEAHTDMSGIIEHNEGPYSVVTAWNEDGKQGATLRKIRFDDQGSIIGVYSDWSEYLFAVRDPQ